MAFQQSAFQHNAFQVGVNGAAAADAVVRGPTIQQEKRRPQVIATVAVNLLVSTLAAVAPPVTPPVQASAPQYRWQNADTSAGMAQVLRTVVPPVIVAAHDAPARSKWQPSDTSLGVPKPLYADAQLPVQNAPHTAPDRLRPVVDTSQKQPITLQVIADPLPPGNAEQLGPVFVRRTLPDTSASTPKPLYADVIQPVLRVPTYQQGKAWPEVAALQYPNLVAGVTPPVAAPIQPYPTVQQVQAWPRMPVILCPPSLKAGPLGNSYSIRLEWTDITGEDGYRVKWGWTSGNYAQTRDVAADVTSYDIDGLPLYQNVYWVVCSMLGGVEQTCTTEIGLTVGRGHTPTTGHIVIEGNVPSVTQATAPIRPQVHTAPDRPRPVTDTSRGQPITLQAAIIPPPPFTLPHQSPARYPYGLADTSGCTPKTLYDDVITPPVVPPVAEAAPAGSAKRGRKPHQYYVEWRDRLYKVSGEREGLELLRKLRADESAKLARTVPVLAKRAVKHAAPPPVEAPHVGVSAGAPVAVANAAEQIQRALAEEYRREVEAGYIRALEWRIARLRDDNDGLLALLVGAPGAPQGDAMARAVDISRRVYEVSRGAYNAEAKRIYIDTLAWQATWLADENETLEALVLDDD